jgi:hypothetical protein
MMDNTPSSPSVQQLWTALSTQNTKYPLRVMKRIMAAKLTSLTQKIEMLLNLVAEAALLAFLSPNGKFMNFSIHLHTHSRLHLACKIWTVMHSTSVFYVIVHGIREREGRGDRE